MITRKITPIACLFALTFASGGLSAAAAGATQPPTTPTNLRVTATTPTSVNLAWGPSTDNSGSFYYRGEITPGYPTWAMQSQTSRDISGLWPQTTYSIVMQAVDSAGNRSAFSNTVTFTTPPDTSPPTVPTLSVSSVAPTRIAVGWTPSFDNVTMVHYRLLVNGAERPGDGQGRTGDLKRGRGQVLLNLPPETSYTFVVIARDGFGNSVQSNPVTATTPPITDFVAPSAPTNLRGRDDGGGCEAYISWNGSTDNTPGSIMYRLYANGQIANTEIGATNTVAFSHVLGPGVTEFVVVAIDGSGNVSAPSNLFPLTVRGC
jgi:chitodextrinase